MEEDQLLGSWKLANLVLLSKLGVFTFTYEHVTYICMQCSVLEFFGILVKHYYYLMRSVATMRSCMITVKGDYIKKLNLLKHSLTIPVLMIMEI
jgi:hypothetical protein